MPSWRAFSCVVTASLAALSLGLDVGMISSTLVQPSFKSYFNHPTTSQTGGIVASFSAGSIIGAFGCSLLGDSLGRVWCLRIGACIAVIGCALQAGAVHLAMLIMGRVVNGLGAGLLTAVFPIYASELAPTKIRGALGGLQMLMIEIAIFVATATGYAFGIYYSNDVQWRGPLAVQAIPVAALIPVTFFLPETPRWLILTGKDAQALHVIRSLHENKENESEAEQDFQEIKTRINAEQAMYEPTWKQIALKPSWRRRAVLVCAIQFFSQATGINCIQYYAATIYNGLGYSTTQSLLINLLYGAFGLIFSIFWVATVDRLPRVKLLIYSSLFMAATLLVQSILSAVYHDPSHANQNALRTEISMFFLFQLGFIAVGMLAWLIPPEMTPVSIRAKINSLSTSVNYLSGLVVAEVSPIALGAIKFKFFYVFMALNILACFIYFFFLPETSKLSLEEMGVQFGDEVVEVNTNGDGKPGSEHREQVEAC